LNELIPPKTKQSVEKKQ